MNEFDAGESTPTVYLQVVQNNGGASPGEPATGIDHTDFTSIRTLRLRGTTQGIGTLATHTNADDSHSAGSVKEVDPTNAPGLVRVDIPSTAVATGSPFVLVLPKMTGNLHASPVVCPIRDLKVRGDAAVASSRAAESVIPVYVNDGSATSTAFILASDIASYTLSASDDRYNDRFVVLFTSGSLRGEHAKITDYNGTTKQVTVEAGLSAAPSNGDKAVLVFRAT